MSMQLGFKWAETVSGGHNFFLGLLKSFSMTSREREAIEAAARFFGVKSKRISLPNENWQLKYNAFFDQMKKYFQVACAVIDRGESCRDSQFCTARCFRIVNTGGFDIRAVQAVQAVVDRAAEAIEAKGFEFLCYGDVNVTKTVLRDTKILAFYVLRDDSMWVRANLKGVEGAALRTIIHELGHRLDHRFAAPTTRAMWSQLYREYLRQGVIGGKPPTPGSEFTDNEGVTWIVQSVERNTRTGDGTITMHRREDNLPVGVSPVPRGATMRGRFPLSAWLRKTGGADLFPTNYARTSATEFFAEMFDGWVQGSLAEKQHHDFKPIVERVLADAHSKMQGGQTSYGITRGRRSTSAASRRRA